MYKNAHCHEQRHAKTRAVSSVREPVSKYVKCDLTETQISNLLPADYPAALIETR